ncbi:hypothetical protein D3C72_1532360 [compost metagenome]
MRPEWPICMAMRASLLACTKSTMRRQASRCASFHKPGHPGVMRASGDTQVISATTMPAPPSAREPRWTRWKSPGTPSVHEYIAIGDTTTRFFSVTPRTRNGVNIGGSGWCSRSCRLSGCTPACRASQCSNCAT